MSFDIDTDCCHCYCPIIDIFTASLAEVSTGLWDQIFSSGSSWFVVTKIDGVSVTANFRTKLEEKILLRFSPWRSQNFTLKSYNYLKACAYVWTSFCAASFVYYYTLDNIFIQPSSSVDHVFNRMRSTPPQSWISSIWLARNDLARPRYVLAGLLQIKL